MKFTYTKFGTLKEVQVAPPYWHIVNEEGKKASINYQQYARGQGFLEKLNELVGHPVVYRTTRRDESKGETGEWPSDHWFSDVFLDDGLSHNWPKEGDKETVQTIVELRLEIKRAAKRAERELKEAEQQRDFDQKQTEGMLKFEAEIEAIPYNEYVSKMNTDEMFRGIYEQFVKWKSARLRTEAERDQYEDQKAAWYKNFKPLNQMGFDWRYIGRIGSWEVSPDGNLKVWGEEYGEWYHFAFPQHVFFRTLQIEKLPILQKHSVWALVNDDDHTKDITYVDMTVRHFHDDEIDVPMDGYRTLHQTELLPHLIDKINDNAAHAEIQASGYGELAAELQMVTPSDDELVYWSNMHMRIPSGDISSQFELMKPENLREFGDEWNRMYRFYKERRAKPDGEELFNQDEPIEGVENYSWVELTNEFEWNWNNEDKSLYIDVGPVADGETRIWDYNAGSLQQEYNHRYTALGLGGYRLNTMRNKLKALSGYPILVFANPIGQFVDVRLNEGNILSMEPMKHHEDSERLARLEQNIRDFGKGNLELLEDQAAYVSELMDKYDEAMPDDEVLIHFHNTQVRSYFKAIGGIDKEAFEKALPSLMENDPQFLKTFRQYNERKAKVEADTGKPFHTDRPIESHDSYKWIELPAGFKVTERAENPHSPNHFRNTPVIPLGIYYEQGDIRRWTFDGGPEILSARTDGFNNHHDFYSEDMRKKCQQLEFFPIYLLVNEQTNTFIDITIADGRLDDDKLPLIEVYEDREPENRFLEFVRAYAKARSEQADTFETAYLEARGELSQLTEERRVQVQAWTDQVTENWEMLENEPRFRLLIIGMAVFANDRNGKSAVTHVDATLAVRCGINTSTKSKLVVDIYDRNYRRGEFNQNMVEAIINPDEEGNGQSVTIGIGKSSHKNYWDKWIITTAYSADSKLESALKKLGYRDFDRDNKTKPIGYFLRLHKDAIAMVRDRNHPYWKNPPARS